MIFSWLEWGGFCLRGKKKKRDIIIIFKEVFGCQGKLDNSEEKYWNWAPKEVLCFGMSWELRFGVREMVFKQSKKGKGTACWVPLTPSLVSYIQGILVLSSQVMERLFFKTSKMQSEWEVWGLLRLKHSTTVQIISTFVRSFVWKPVRVYFVRHRKWMCAHVHTRRSREPPRAFSAPVELPMTATQLGTRPGFQVNFSGSQTWLRYGRYTVHLQM